MSTRTLFSRFAVSATMLCGALSAVLMGIQPSQAADVDWKMHLALVPARPEAQAYQHFVDLVNKKAGDALKIRLFGSSSLGVKDADMLRILPRGNIIQATGLYPGYLSRDLPHYAYTLPPGVVSEPEKLQEILPDLRKIYEMAYTEHGIKLLGFVGHAVRDTHIMCKEPVNSLDKLRGKKLRVWEQFQVDVFEKLGISAQIVGQNDLYVAMQTGVIDCAVYPVGMAVSVSLQEVAPYASYLLPFVLHPWNTIVSQKSFDALPAKTQQVVLDAAQTVENESFESYLSGINDKKALETFRAGGGKLLDPFPAEDQKAFVKAARETWKKLSARSGKEGLRTYELLVQAIK